MQSLLYRSMEKFGVRVARFSWRRLLIEQWDVWHLHWPEYIVNTPNTSKLVLGLLNFWAKLKLARIKNVRIFWTVHNLRPHERDHPLLERIFWRMFLPEVDGLICMSESGKQQLYRQHPRARAHPVYVIPHGHYRGAYPDAIGRENARRALGIKSDEFVVTFLGLIRAYKGVPHLIRCFKASGLMNTRLVIAGRPHTNSTVRDLEEAAAGNSNVQFFLDFVGRDDIQIFLRAADLVALPYNEILNSGSAILALSFDRPILVPAAGALAELYEAVGPEWVRLYEGDLTPEIVREAVEWAAGRPKQERNSAPLHQMNWDRIAKLTIAAFTQ